jgi:DNA polymerase III delta prime subunit
MTLRDYQLTIRDRGVAILKEHGMLYLAMEVRTGKTLTALAIAEEYGAFNVLFCTKKKVLDDIGRQYESIPHTFDFDVINYESLHKLEDPNEYDFIILDEAHCLGAFPKPAERTQALKKFVRSRPVVYLSGTPTPESWSQIFHQLWISQRSPFGHPNFYSWAKEYTYPSVKHFYNRAVNDYSKAKVEPIREKVDHLFISFTQAEAGFSETIDEEIVWVTMQPKTMNLIDKLRRDGLYENKQGRAIVADTAAKIMNKVHQLCSGTVITDLPDRKSVVVDRTKAKYILDRFEGQKIAIFYKFVEEWHLLNDTFGDRLAATPEEFNATDADTWYVSQIQSGREGINLSAADAIVMLTIDHSAVSYFQARARLQTKDRKKTAKVYWLFSVGGIEEKIYRSVIRKKDYTLAHFKRDFLKDVDQNTPDVRNHNNQT